MTTTLNITQQIDRVTFIVDELSEVVNVNVTEGQDVVAITVSEVGQKGDPGETGSSDNLVFGEVPSGAVNGSNATFTTTFSFVPESVQIFVNGLLQKIISDYNTSGTTTITLLASPTINENLLVNYKKQ